jgi:hypothetical protein
MPGKGTRADLWTISEASMCTTAHSMNHGHGTLRRSKRKWLAVPSSCQMSVYGLLCLYVAFGCNLCRRPVLQDCVFHDTAIGLNVSMAAHWHICLLLVSPCNLTDAAASLTMIAGNARQLVQFSTRYWI